LKKSEQNYDSVNSGYKQVRHRKKVIHRCCLLLE